MSEIRISPPGETAKPNEESVDNPIGMSAISMGWVAPATMWRRRSDNSIFQSVSPAKGSAWSLKVCCAKIVSEKSGFPEFEPFFPVGGRASATGWTVLVDVGEAIEMVTTVPEDDEIISSFISVLLIVIQQRQPSVSDNSTAQGGSLRV